MAAPRLLDQYGRPIDTSALRQQQAGATLGGVRSIITGHPASGLTPSRLATVLRSAEALNTTAYFELAEEMEEKDLHYLGVLGTRKRQVAQLEITVEAASDAADDVANADLVREWLRRDSLQDDLFDILDAVGKGVSVTEILWDVSASQWWPGTLQWIDPRWLYLDRADGRTIMLKDGSGGGLPLTPFKFITHEVKAKSGLPIRGGLARPVAWAWMFKNYTVKDWVAFAEVYGLPLRVGKYDASATESDKEALLRAVSDISSDAAAIIPKSMEIDFVDGKMGAADGALFEKAADWFDRQVSKAVLGQTGTTDMQSGGGFAQSKTLDGVREDIEQADAVSVAGTINRDVVRPLIDLNRGPPASGKYPRIAIGRAESWDAVKLMPAVVQLVSMGGKVGMKGVRDRIGLPEPATDEELLTPPAAPIVEPGAPPLENPLRPAPVPPQPEQRQAASHAFSRALAAAFEAARRPSSDPTRQPDEVDRFVDTVLGDWEPLAKPLIQPLEELLAHCSTLQEFRDGLAGALADMNSPALVELLARGGFSARLAGIAALQLEEPS